MVTTPIATGSVGGRYLKSRVSEKKTPVARQNAAIQRKAALMRSKSGVLRTRRECSSGADERFDGRVGVARARFDPLPGIAVARAETLDTREEP